MLLTPQQETALHAVLCSNRTSLGDWNELRKLQIELMRRARVRQSLDEQSARTKEFNP